MSQVSPNSLKTRRQNVKFIAIFCISLFLGSNIIFEQVGLALLYRQRQVYIVEHPYFALLPLYPVLLLMEVDRASWRGKKVRETSLALSQPFPLTSLVSDTHTLPDCNCGAPVLW